MDTTMIVKYKVSSFLYLHNDFWYNSLGSTCTCQSLIVGPNVKLNFRFAGRPIVNHCEGHNSVIRSAIEVHAFKQIWSHVNISSVRSSNHHDILPLFLPEATLSSWACYSSLRLQPKLEHRGHLGGHNKGVQVNLEVQFMSGSSLPRSSEAVCTKIDAQVAYEVQIRRSTYGWKTKEISFPIPPVPCQYDV